MLPDYDNSIFKYTEKNGNSYWVVEFPDLPGCSAIGKTKSEALAESELAKELWLADYFEDYGKYPEPSIKQTEYSGKFVLRTSKSLHKQLAERAEFEGVSLNNLCNILLAAALERRSWTYNRYQENIQLHVSEDHTLYSTPSETE